MDDKLTEWLRNSLESWQPTTADVIKASRHLKNYERKQLFSGSGWERRRTLGKLYEYSIYERILTLAQGSSPIKYIVRKGRDVPKGICLKTGLAQNGLFYSRRGDIYVRGNGQDLAEFDILLVDSQDSIVLIEVLESMININDFADECHYKRNLLEFLFGNRVSDPVVVSSIDLLRNANCRKLFSQTENHFVRTKPIEDLVSALDSTKLKEDSDVQHDYGKLVTFSELQPREFDYRSHHDREKRQLIEAALQPTHSVENLAQKARLSIVKNVIIGILNKSAIKYLLGTKQMVVPPLQDPLSNQEFLHHFAKTLLVLSLPELRPTLYLKVRNRCNYLKMGPASLTTFKFERNIEAQHTEFYGWLEETDLFIGKTFSQKILDYYLREHVVGWRMKRPQFPKF